MKKVIFSLSVILVLGLVSCGNCDKKNADAGPVVAGKLSNDYMTMSVLFQQKAAEYKSLCYQAFNIARLVTDMSLADKSIKMKRAIILDIDETVLDNSPYQAKCILDTIGYPLKWNEWCDLAQAGAMPGAVEFLNYASSKGIEIFYVSNRKQITQEGTMKNLREKGFPMVDDNHMFLRANDAKTNSKQERRNAIEKDFHIVLYLGDNLADFSASYDEADEVKRNSVTDSLMNYFGSKFIMLPNAMYGDWEMALYNRSEDTTAALKAGKRRALLKGF